MEFSDTTINQALAVTEAIMSCSTSKGRLPTESELRANCPDLFNTERQQGIFTERT